MTSHSSILAWKIPWTEESRRLPSTGSQRVGPNWATSLHFRPAVPRQECKERSLLDSVEFGGFWGTSPSWMSQALWEGGGGVGWGRQKGR